MKLPTNMLATWLLLYRSHNRDNNGPDRTTANKLRWIVAVFLFLAGLFSFIACNIGLANESETTTTQHNSFGNLRQGWAGKLANDYVYLVDFRRDDEEFMCCTKTLPWVPCKMRIYTHKQKFIAYYYICIILMAVKKKNERKKSTILTCMNLV